MAKAWPGDVEISFSGTGLTATQTKLIGFPEAPRTRNAEPTKNLASSSDKRAITSECCAVAVSSSAANAMVGNPAVADAAAIIVLNSRKPRREIPMLAPPRCSLLGQCEPRKDEPCRRQSQSENGGVLIRTLPGKLKICFPRLTFTGLWGQTRSLHQYHLVSRAQSVHRGMCAWSG